MLGRYTDRAVIAILVVMIMTLSAGLFAAPTTLQASEAYNLAQVLGLIAILIQRGGRHE